MHALVQDLDALPYGITRSPGIAIAMCCAPMSLDRCAALPPPDAIGTVVVIAAAGRIIGCARLTGVVTLAAAPSAFEHRSASSIRASLGADAALFGPHLWVFEDGFVFDAPIVVDTTLREDCWVVPAPLLEPVAAAMRALVAAWSGPK